MLTIYLVFLLLTNGFTQGQNFTPNIWTVDSDPTDKVNVSGMTFFHSMTENKSRWPQYTDGSNDTITKSEPDPSINNFASSSSIFGSDTSNKFSAMFPSDNKQPPPSLLTDMLHSSGTPSGPLGGMNADNTRVPELDTAWNVGTPNIGGMAADTVRVPGPDTTWNAGTASLSSMGADKVQVPGPDTTWNVGTPNIGGVDKVRVPGPDTTWNAGTPSIGSMGAGKDRLTETDTPWQYTPDTARQQIDLTTLGIQDPILDTANLNKAITDTDLSSQTNARTPTLSIAGKFVDHSNKPVFRVKTKFVDESNNRKPGFKTKSAFIDASKSEPLSPSFTVKQNGPAPPLSITTTPSPTLGVDAKTTTITGINRGMSGLNERINFRELAANTPRNVGQYTTTIETPRRDETLSNNNNNNNNNAGSSNSNKNNDNNNNDLTTVNPRTRPSTNIQIESLYPNAPFPIDNTKAVQPVLKPVDNNMIANLENVDRSGITAQDVASSTRDTSGIRSQGVDRDTPGSSLVPVVSNIPRVIKNQNAATADIDHFETEPNVQVINPRNNGIPDNFPNRNAGPAISSNGGIANNFPTDQNPGSRMSGNNGLPGSFPTNRNSAPILDNNNGIPNNFPTDQNSRPVTNNVNGSPSNIPINRNSVPAIDNNNNLLNNFNRNSRPINDNTNGVQNNFPINRNLGTASNDNIGAPNNFPINQNTLPANDVNSGTSNNFPINRNPGSANANINRFSNMVQTDRNTVSANDNNRPVNRNSRPVINNNNAMSNNLPINRNSWPVTTNNNAPVNRNMEPVTNNNNGMPTNIFPVDRSSRPVDNNSYNIQNNVPINQNALSVNDNRNGISNNVPINRNSNPVFDNNNGVSNNFPIKSNTGAVNENNNVIRGNFPNNRNTLPVNKNNNVIPNNLPSRNSGSITGTNNIPRTNLVNQAPDLSQLDNQFSNSRGADSQAIPGNNPLRPQQGSVPRRNVPTLSNDQNSGILTGVNRNNGLNIATQNIPRTNNAGINNAGSAVPTGKFRGGINQLPGNVKQVPGNVNQVPGSTNQMPGNVNQMPGNVNQVPGNVNRVPGSTNQMPGNANQLPGNVNQLPGNVNQVPGSINQLPGNVNQVRGNVNQVPGSMNQDFGGVRGVNQVPGVNQIPGANQQFSGVNQRPGVNQFNGNGLQSQNINRQPGVGQNRLGDPRSNQFNTNINTPGMTNGQNFGNFRPNFPNSNTAASNFRNTGFQQQGFPSLSQNPRSLQNGPVSPFSNNNNNFQTPPNMDFSSNFGQNDVDLSNNFPSRNFQGVPNNFQNTLFNDNMNQFNQQQQQQQQALLARARNFQTRRFVPNNFVQPNRQFSPFG